MALGGKRSKSFQGKAGMDYFSERRDFLLPKKCPPTPSEAAAHAVKILHLRARERRRVCPPSPNSEVETYGRSVPDGVLRAQPNLAQRKPQAAARARQRRGRRVRRQLVQAAPDGKLVRAAAPAPPRIFRRRQAGGGSRTIHRPAAPRNGEGARRICRTSSLPLSSGILNWVKTRKLNAAKKLAGELEACEAASRPPPFSLMSYRRPSPVAIMLSVSHTSDRALNLGRPFLLSFHLSPLTTGRVKHFGQVRRHRRRDPTAYQPEAHLSADWGRR